MNLFLDTEFNGHGGELISMALVHDRGFWYGIRQLPAKIDPWVADNVIPKLGRAPFWTDDEFRHSLHTYLCGIRDPEIICDWHTDAAHFLWWLDGPTYDTSFDYACRIRVLRTPPEFKSITNPHNALADAADLMAWYSSGAPAKGLRRI